MLYLKGLLGGLGGIVLACVAFYLGAMGSIYARFGEVRSWTHVAGVNTIALSLVLSAGFVLGAYLVVR
jgi:hypothetical protein